MKVRLLFVAAIAGLGLAVAALANSGSSGSSSGIYGRVLLGPPCPVSLEIPTQCRDHPVRASIAVRRSGKRVTTLRSGDDGRFRQALRAGTYRLIPRPRGNASAPPQTVHVPHDSFVRVLVRYRSSKR